MKRLGLIVLALVLCSPAGWAEALVPTVTRTVRATLGFSVSAPQVVNPSWDVFLPRPPEIQGRQAVISSTHPAGAVVEARGNAVYEINARGQGISGALEMEIRLTGVELVEGWRASAVSGLTPGERARYLAATRLYDFRSAEFRSWMRQRDLLRKSGEDDVALGRRIFLFIKRAGHYEHTAEMDRISSHVARSCTSDCGGLQILFGSVMRANGVPFRALVGRWAQSARPDVGQYHVKGEFYADRVGWVPVDLSSAVLFDRSEEGLRFFGQDPGNFIVLHFDPEVTLATRSFGPRTIDWLQGFVYWVNGGGTLQGSKAESTWTVNAAGN
ncbi:MAG: hypothetical protein FJX76_10910 [Armatimonadetes bacterium]|nr:hypothetical protein [Armatimonadota bacterium]